MKNKNMWQSVKCAIAGLISGFKEEKNFIRYYFAIIVCLILNILVKSNKYEFIICISIAAVAIAIEYINTAIERIVDKFILEKNADAKFIKDVSAGAVLVIGILFFSVEGFIIIGNVIC